MIEVRVKKEKEDRGHYPLWKKVVEAGLRVQIKTMDSKEKVGAEATETAENPMRALGIEG